MRVSRLFAPLLAVGTLAGSAACRDDIVGGLAGSVSGVVCNDVTGRRAPGAQVTARYARPDNGEPAERTVTADDTGFFELGGLPDVMVKLAVRGEDFASTLADVQVVVTEVVVVTDPACRDAPPEPGKGVLVGQICNRHTGEYVGSGTVTLAMPEGEPLMAQIGEEGRFRLEDIPEGTYIAYVQTPGFARSYRVEIVAGDEPTLLEDQVIACEPYDPLSTGIITGRVCGVEVDGVPGVPVGGARVYIVGAIDGIIYEDETLPDGSFTIAGIPAPRAGLQVRVEKGGFTYTWPDDTSDPTAVAVAPITTDPDGTHLTADVGCQPLVPDDGRRYLVVKGSFDRIEDVLGRIGLTNVDLAEGVPIDISTTFWTAEVFGNYERLKEYAAVFVNCGVLENDLLLLDSSVKANLRRYIQEGGSLYISDWAYDLVEAVWPEKINFLGDDAANSAAEFGVDGDYVMEIADPALRAHVGSDTVTIGFQFGYYAIISQLAPGVTTYLRGDMRYRVNDGVSTLMDAPVTVSFNDGLGRVIFTAFHQETAGRDAALEVLDGPEDQVLRFLIFSL